MKFFETACALAIAMTLMRGSDRDFKCLHSKSVVVSELYSTCICISFCTSNCLHTIEIILFAFLRIITRNKQKNWITKKKKLHRIEAQPNNKQKFHPLCRIFPHQMRKLCIFAASMSEQALYLSQVFPRNIVYQVAYRVYEFPKKNKHHNVMQHKKQINLFHMKFTLRECNLMCSAHTHTSTCHTYLTNARQEVHKICNWF